MFWTIKSDPAPFGVPLNLLQVMLTAGNQKVRREGNRLVSHNGKLETIIEVTCPDDIETDGVDIQAIATIKNELEFKSTWQFGQCTGHKLSMAFCTTNSE